MKLMPATPTHWAAYIASLTMMGVIATRMPTTISLFVTMMTLALWAWLAHGNRKNADKQACTAGALDTQAIQTARTAVGLHLQKNSHQHLMPAMESLQQMTNIISDGTRRLQLSFTALNRKSGQQLTLLNTMLTRHKGSEIEDFDREVDTTLGNSSLIAKDIQQDVSNAVTAMQFEDSSTQIAQYIQAQLQATHATMDIICKELLKDTDIVECLNRIDCQLQTHQTSELRQVVTATDMRAGEIDLF